MVFQNCQTGFIRTLLRQQPKAESWTIFFLGIGVDSGLILQLKSSVESVLEELGYANVDIATQVIEDAERFSGDFSRLGVTLPKRPTLVLPVIELSRLPSEPPGVMASQIVQLILYVESCSFQRKAVEMDDGTQVIAPVVALPLLVTTACTSSLAIARLVANEVSKSGCGAHIAVRMGATRTCETNILKTDGVSAFAFHERWAPLWVAILAAGKSSRMGRSKQVEPVNGVPMVVSAVTSALRSGAHNIIIVTGAYADEVNAVLNQTKLSLHPRIHVIHNPSYAEGQATSVHTAIEYLQKRPGYQNQVPQLGAVAFMPVDQPNLQPVLLAHLFRLWRKGAQIAAPAVGGIPRGAPALFDHQLLPHFGQLDGDTGAKVLLHQFKEQLVTIETPEDFLFDIDSPSDLDLAK